jgi:hypothetical protein
VQPTLQKNEPKTNIEHSLTTDLCKKKGKKSPIFTRASPRTKIFEEIVMQTFQSFYFFHLMINVDKDEKFGHAKHLNVDWKKHTASLS